jgi:hypothetical protein
VLGALQRLCLLPLFDDHLPLALFKLLQAAGQFSFLLLALAQRSAQPDLFCKQPISFLLASGNLPLEQVDGPQALAALHHPLCLNTVQLGQPFVQSCLLESQRNELTLGILAPCLQLTQPLLGHRQAAANPLCPTMALTALGMQLSQLEAPLGLQVT